MFTTARALRPAILGLVLLTALALTGCSADRPSGSASNQAGQTSASVAQFLTSQPAARTAVLKLAAADGNNNSGYNFDGYANGQLVFTVPMGWTVKGVLTNSGMMPHSAIVISQQAQHAYNVSTPAFPGAETPDPNQGASMGQEQHFSFAATKPGVYVIACGISGHDADGMWDTLVVSAAAKAPGVTRP